MISKVVEIYIRYVGIYQNSFILIDNNTSMKCIKGIILTIIDIIMRKLIIYSNKNIKNKHTSGRINTKRNKKITNSYQQVVRLSLQL